MPTTVTTVFGSCMKAISDGVLITRQSSRDKEFHFQDWVEGRLTDTAFHFDGGGRNTYPDFSAVEATEGYEVKGLAYPGREANYDCNSQVPSGHHNGRTIFYVFGRYPKTPDGDSYPVLDLVLCHGDFLNANHDYEHHNRSVKGFGTYGDIMIRDRKMYVAPTPFGLLEGVAHTQTLILPDPWPVGEGFSDVGDLVRVEAKELVVAYTFDLTTNEIAAQRLPNPNAGREHRFKAWRVAGLQGGSVKLRV